MTMLHQIQEKIPAKVQKSLVEVDSAFVMGGFITSCMHDEPFSDIDIFCHYNDIPRFISLLGVKDEEITTICKDYPSLNHTSHVLKTAVDGVLIDVVSYSSVYNPSYKVDFYSRMLCYDGHGVYADDDISFYDAYHKVLRFNPNYGLTMKEYFRVLDIVYGRSCECDDCMTSFYSPRQITMIRNIRKYLDRGYVVY